ncbi:MAG: hypothetical protein L3K16_04465 [Thermoplasmata archaeon]|nr:hypothetical protein [Thermoplasmata archaeon]
MSARTARAVGAAFGAILVLAVLIIPAASATPVGVAPASTSAAAAVQEWGYGGSHWANSTGTISNDTTVAIHAYLGVQVVVREVNTSATTFELTANRTMVLDYFALYCHPSCTNPGVSANISVRAWEVARGSDNFTTAGQVVGPNGPVAAIALVNSSVSASANLTESTAYNVSGPFATHRGTQYFSIHSSANAAVSLSPALGLVPENLSSTPNWAAVSAFAAQGEWSWGSVYAHVPLSGLPSHTSDSGSGAVNRSGNLTLTGTDLGPIGLRGGLAASAVRIAIVGPFAFRDGLILVPIGADLFGGGGTWQSEAPTGQSATTQAVDFAAAAGSRPLIRASETSFVGNSAEPVTTAGVVPMVAAEQSEYANGTLQAEPETSSQATSQSACMLAGTCATTSPGGPASHARLGGVVVLTIAVVGLTVVVVGLVMARQPPRKELPSPNSNLYPQGRIVPVAPPARTPVPPPEADDPLGHLW